MCHQTEQMEAKAPKTLAACWTWVGQRGSRLQRYTPTLLWWLPPPSPRHRQTFYCSKNIPWICELGVEWQSKSGDDDQDGLQVSTKLQAREKKSQLYSPVLCSVVFKVEWIYLFGSLVGPYSNGGISWKKLSINSQNSSDQTIPTCVSSDI